MKVLDLFTGGALGTLATKYIHNHKVVGYVEYDDYCQRIIAARIRDGLLDDAPIFGDINTFISEGFAAGYTGLVDGITAGFPCQPFAAGGKRRGEDDVRNGWPATIRVARIVKPKWIFLENSVNLLSPFRKLGRPAYFGRVLSDLAAAGYDAEWGCLSAGELGYSHKRDRLWLLAYASQKGRQRILRNNNRGIKKTRRRPAPKTLDQLFDNISRMEKSLGEPSIFRINDGHPHRVERLGVCGNGQVPECAGLAYKLLGGQS